MEETVYSAPERINADNSGKINDELNKLIEDGAVNLVFDMWNLQYISSAGLRVLLAVQKKMSGKGSFVLKNVPEAVREILDVTGFSSLLVIK